MTESQKKQVLQLRSAGVSFAEIADQTGLTASSLRTFCSRNKAPKQIIKPVVTPTGLTVCAECGGIILDNHTTREKRFCSQKCYRRWYHRNVESQRTQYRSVCLVCGSEFYVSSKKNQQYCSMACYQKSRRGAAANG